MPVDFKENASQSQTLNYRERPRKVAISLCLVGILAGGVIGEVLREEMVASSHQHLVFSALLNSSEVKAALAKSGGDSPSANQMIQVDGPWARDLFWQDGQVAYFVLADGSFYFDAARPPIWVVPMVLLCPVFGFLIPWGTMKALSAMGVDYFAKKPPPPHP
ncbi:MAG: hypothetical protein ABSE86_34900 [Bryobacteraceae bacterium]